MGAGAQDKIIYADKPLSIGSTRNATDMPVPVEFQGLEFLVPLYRKNHYIYVKNPHDEEVEIKFYDGANSSFHRIDAGRITRLYTDNNNAVATVNVINSDRGVLVSHRTTANGDAYAVPPTATRVYGIFSENVRASIMATGQIGQRISSDHSFFNVDNIDALEYFSLLSGNIDSQGAGDFIRLASPWYLSAVQIADADGSETTAFLSKDFFFRHFVLPTHTQYVAIGCVDAGTVINAIDSNGATIDTVNCEGANGDTPGKAYLGSKTNGQHFARGTRIESNNPIYLIYEDAATQDERNLMGLNPAPALGSLQTTFLHEEQDVLLSWELASNNSADSYELRRSVDGGSSWTTIYAGIYSDYLDQSLADGLYVYQIRACDHRCGEWMEFDEVKVYSQKPSDISFAEATYDNSTGLVTFNWAAPAEYVTHYAFRAEVGYGDWTDDDWQAEKELLEGVDGSQTEVSFIANGNESFALYMLRACNNFGCSDSSYSPVPYIHVANGPGAGSAPEPPTGFEHNFYSSGNVRVTWDGPKDSSVYYEIQVAHEDDDYGSTVTSDYAESPLINTNGTYWWYVRVKACNSHSCSDWASTHEYREPDNVKNCLLYTSDAADD